MPIASGVGGISFDGISNLEVINSVKLILYPNFSSQEWEWHNIYEQQAYTPALNNSRYLEIFTTYGCIHKCRFHLHT